MNSVIHKLLLALAAVMLSVATEAGTPGMKSNDGGAANTGVAEVGVAEVGTVGTNKAEEINIADGYKAEKGAKESPYIYNKVDTLQADSAVSALSALAEAGVNVSATDSVKTKKHKRDWATWTPDPKRAMWLAIVLPGAGQIYNRKYWKLPIVYGGFVGCIYAWRWNNQMYSDYSQAYMDIMDDDPNTQSYNQFLHLGVTISKDNIDRYQNMFKRRKDYYRKYRDLSIFCLIGVYALSVIDAYVDASLSQFDISKDLSLKIEPSVINSRTSTNPIKNAALGLQCSLNF